MDNKGYIKRNVKDSVFTSLFSNVNNIVHLYSTLHPEETISADEIHNVTLKNVLSDNLYNDLGFVVGKRLIVLAEAQSTWSDNIIVRTLMYLTQTYQDYFIRTEQSIYKRKGVQLPVPELYVIYTGDEKIDKSEITMSEVFFGGKKAAVEVTVKIIQYSGANDIVNQYITFCKISTQIISKMGRTIEAIREIVRICCDSNVLKEYLDDMEREVYNIMFALFDDEYIMQSTLRSERREAMEKGVGIGRKEGIGIGRKEGVGIGIAKGVVETCQDLGLSKEDTVTRVKIKFGITEEEAQEKVDEYWK